MHNRMAGSAEFNAWLETLTAEKKAMAMGVWVHLVYDGAPEAEAEAEAVIMLDEGSKCAHLAAYIALKKPLEEECRYWTAARFDLDKITLRDTETPTDEERDYWGAQQRLIEAGVSADDLALFAKGVARRTGNLLIESIDAGEALSGPGPGWALTEEIYGEPTGRKACVATQHLGPI